MRPKITVSIPTRNSAWSLRLCLNALKRQTFKNFEVNIIDKESTDETLQIAREFGIAKTRTVKGSLLQARYEGVKISRSDYVLILDSDQVLEKNALKNALELAERGSFKMLALEEHVFRNKTFLEKLFAYDRTLINSVNDLSPFTGVIMPRFFLRSLLIRAYKNIPGKIFPHTGGPDHAIVYYEAWRITKKVGVLPNAVRHIEPASLFDLVPKFFRWGYTSVDAGFGKYAKLMRRKERFRTGLFANGLIKESLGSVLLLILKGVPFKIGFYTAKLNNMLGLRRKY